MQTLRYRMLNGVNMQTVTDFKSRMRFRKVVKQLARPSNSKIEHIIKVALREILSFEQSLVAIRMNLGDKIVVLHVSYM